MRTRTSLLCLGIGLWVGLSSAAAQTYTRTEQITYHDDLGKWVLGQQATLTVNGTLASQTTYNANAQPTVFTSFGKTVQTLTYHGDGTVATVKDGNHHTTTLSSWKRGIPQLIQHADSTSQSAVVNDAGWLTQVTDQNGFATNYTYDAMGRLASIVYPTGDTTAWNTTTQVFQQVAGVEYGIPAGHWRQTIATGNGRKITYFDALWRPLVIREYDTANEAGTQRFQRFTYDHAGRTTFASYPAAHNPATGIWSEYDALGRPTSVAQDSEHGLLTTTTEYLSGFRTRTTNPRGHQTTTSYLAWDQPTQDYPVAISHPEGAYTDIVRDGFGQPTRLTRRNSTGSLSVHRDYVYDGHRQLCKSIEPETGATVMGYDGAGNLTWSAAGLTGGGYASPADCSHTDAWHSGRRADRTYDSRNRLLTLSFPDSNGNQSWAYTPDGLPASIVTQNDGGSTQTVNAYSYNKRRMLTGESSGQAGWYTWGLGYGYDANGHLTSQTYPTGLAISYYPNALGQTTQVSDQFSNVYASGISYHPNGAIAQFTYGNGIVHTMTQNARQLPVDVVSSGTLHEHYGYDANGNVNAIIDVYNGGHVAWTPRNRWLQYDALDRLTAAGSGMFGGWHWHNFTYDVLDNMKSWTLTGVKDHAEYVYDARNQLANIKNSGGATVMGLGYDAQGNLQNRNGQLYSFDYGNRLREVNGQEIYRYDGHGRRVVAWSPALGVILSQYSQSGQILYQEDYRTAKTAENIYLAGSLLAIRDWTFSGTLAVKYQHTDALGSPIAVTDGVGAVIDRTDWEPYGAAIGKPSYQGVGYTGHVMDAATGLTYMQQRYYDPQIGRFLSTDPVTALSSPVGMFNRYKYAANNPYRFVDPDGRQEKEERQRTDFRSMSSHPGLGGAAISGLPDMGGAQQSSNAGAYGRPLQASDPAWTRDSGVRKQTEKAWDESNPNAPSVPRGQEGSTKKEQSGWVVQFFGSANPQLVRLGPGTRDQASRDALNKPSEFACNCRVLGFFHTHPNTWEEKYIPNANGYDYQFQLYMGVPGLVRSHEGYEYVPIPEAK